MEYQVDIAALIHEDKCRFHDNPGFCDCGAVEYEKLKQCEARLAAAEQDNERLKYWDALLCTRCHGIGEITVISGQTPENYSQDNIPCPDCVGPIIDRAEAAEKERGELRAEVEGLLSKRKGPTGATYSHLIRQRDTLKTENERLAGEVERLRGSATSACCEEISAKNPSALCAKLGQRITNLRAANKELRQDLTAAQQSAKEQFRAGMERAADRIAEYRANRPTTEAGMLIAEECEILIREAAKEEP